MNNTLVIRDNQGNLKLFEIYLKIYNDNIKQEIKS